MSHRFIFFVQSVEIVGINNNKAFRPRLLTIRFRTSPEDEVVTVNYAIDPEEYRFISSEIRIMGNQDEVYGLNFSQPVLHAEMSMTTTPPSPVGGFVDSINIPIPSTHTNVTLNFHKLKVRVHLHCRLRLHRPPIQSQIVRLSPIVILQMIEPILQFHYPSLDPTELIFVREELERTVIPKLFQFFVACQQSSVHTWVTMCCAPPDRPSSPKSVRRVFAELDALFDLPVSNDLSGVSYSIGKVARKTLYDMCFEVRDVLCDPEGYANPSTKTLVLRSTIGKHAYNTVTAVMKGKRIIDVAKIGITTVPLWINHIVGFVSNRTAQSVSGTSDAVTSLFIETLHSAFTSQPFERVLLCLKVICACVATFLLLRTLWVVRESARQHTDMELRKRTLFDGMIQQWYDPEVDSFNKEWLRVWTKASEKIADQETMMKRLE